jgi:hypothetical protein
MPTTSAKGFSVRSWSASVSCAKQSCTVNDVFLPVKGPNWSRPTPTYILSAADWLTLVERFGLVANVKDAARKG